MNDGLIPKRYAKALFKAAGNPATQKQLYGLMKNLASSATEYPGLIQVIRNPYQAVDDKLRLLFTAAGTTAEESPRYADFLELLVRNNRLELVQSIALAYLQLYRQENNIKVVTVTSASQLDATSLERLKKLIQAHLGDASMEFSSSVDPSLTGGFVVTVDNERLDASISNELKQLRLKLLSKQS